MLLPIWDFIKNPDNRTVIAWLCGGVSTVVVAGWAVFKFFADRKKDGDKKGGGTTVTQTGQGAASGRDTNIGVQNYAAPTPELVAQIQKPLADELSAQRAQIENLTKMLLERNPATSAPGAEQAVSAAVQSIAEGAEEGDNRLEIALGLMKENKTVEATELLAAVAEDKTVRIEKDRKEAAIAYRNLGAISGLRDPKAARQAYARAVALDPDNAQGLFWDGWFQLDANNFTAAENSNRALLQLAGKGADEHQIFWARTGLGGIAVARGDLNASLAVHSEARSVMERLAAQDPGNAGWQRDLSVSYAKLASVYRQSGDSAKALEVLRHGHEIISHLTKLSPDNAVWKQDLARFEGQIKKLAP